MGVVNDFHNGQSGQVFLFAKDNAQIFWTAGPVCAQADELVGGYFSLQPINDSGALSVRAEISEGPGIDDAGLYDAAGALRFGTLAPIGGDGMWGLDLSWEQLNAIRPIDAPMGGLVTRRSRSWPGAPR